MNWRQRSNEKEILDGNAFSTQEIWQNMAELNTINQMLGGHRITINGFKKLLGDQRSVRVYEIGCGGGDNLAVIYHWAGKRGIAVHCTGIDLNADCIEFARSRFPEGNYIVGDYRQEITGAKPDIIFSSLFCHHFEHTKLAGQLTWMQDNCRLGFFINDLHRHRIAYYAIKILTAVFSASRLVKHDAPVSVKRGFSFEDWRDLFKSSGIHRYTVIWKWAFRWLVIVKKA